MSGVATAIGASAVIGYAGSKQAGKASAGASEDASKASATQYRTTRADLNPWLRSGSNALSQYNQALGIGGTYANQPMTPEEYAKQNPYTQKHWSPANIMDDGGGYKLSGYQNYLNTYDRGEYTPNQRQETPIYGEFSAPDGSGLPNYTPGADLPQYASKGEFNFDLENDPIYNFQKEEGLRAATRQMNAGGKSNSGNILAELQRRASGIAGEYQNDAFNRQLAQSNTNYGRGVQDYQIGADANNTMFNRNLTNYGVGTDRANALYGRGVGEYTMDAARNSDIYGREQNYLNQLANMAGTGQNAAAQLGAAGTQAVNYQGGVGMQNAANQAQMWQGINNAAQGSVANYLTHDLYSKNPNMLYGGQPGLSTGYTGNYGYRFD